MEKQCMKCGCSLSDGIMQCPNCGELIKPPIMPTWLLVFMCIFFPPVGIYVIWRHTYLLREMKKKLTIIICIWLVTYIIIGLSTSETKNTKEPIEDVVANSDEEIKNEVTQMLQEELNKEEKESDQKQKNEKIEKKKENPKTKPKNNKKLLKEATAGYMDFDYETKNGKIFLEQYNGTKETLYIKPYYKIKGKKYKTDLSDFMLESDDVKFLIIGNGISKILRYTFNSSEVEQVYFPKSMSKIYDSTLAYLTPEEGQKIKIYYGGTKKQWNNIFRKYKRKTLKEAWNSSNKNEERGEAIGASLADKLNEIIGSNKYDSNKFEFYYSVEIKDLK